MKTIQLPKLPLVSETTVYSNYIVLESVYQIPQIVEDGSNTRWVPVPDESIDIVLPSCQPLTRVAIWSILTALGYSSKQWVLASFMATHISELVADEDKF